MFFVGDFIGYCDTKYCDCQYCQNHHKWFFCFALEYWVLTYALWYYSVYHFDNFALLRLTSHTCTLQMYEAATVLHWWSFPWLIQNINVSSLSTSNFEFQSLKPQGSQMIWKTFINQLYYHDFVLFDYSITDYLKECTIFIARKFEEQPSIALPRTSIKTIDKLWNDFESAAVILI